MRQKIAILSGSGLSAESGLPTFRDAAGLWKQHSWVELASPEGWARRPELVLEFYDERRAKAWRAQPNAAHVAIASLEAKHDVVVITQNVDALHERAGSTRVLHLHGELAYARGTGPGRRRRRIDGEPIRIGQTCEEGTQLRPDIVWFGEVPYEMERSFAALAKADLFVSIGTSGAVYPAAGFVQQAKSGGAGTLELNLERSQGSAWFDESRLGPASELVPSWVEEVLR